MFGKSKPNPAAKPKKDKAGWMDAKQYARHAADQRRRAAQPKRKGKRP